VGFDRTVAIGGPKRGAAVQDLPACRWTQFWISHGAAGPWQMLPDCFLPVSTARLFLRSQHRSACDAQTICWSWHRANRWAKADRVSHTKRFGPHVSFRPLPQKQLGACYWYYPLCGRPSRRVPFWVVLYL